jgi:hypothetical protein
VYEAITIMAKSKKLILKLKELTEKWKNLLHIMTVLKSFLKTKNKLRFQNFEKLPKPHALAVQEWLDGKIYHRDSNK